jgi:phosphoribosylanthranilate isomerase
MMVKICGINNLEDALAAIGGGAAAVGFNFWPGSPRYITPESARRVIERLPDAVDKVGVFVDEEPGTIEAVASEAGLHVAQLHGRERASDFPGGLRIWKAVRIRENFDRDALDGYPAEAVLLDGPRNGEPFEWTLAAGISRKVILAGGLDAENVGRAIEQARPWGVDACSRIESAPGKKDHAKMARFLKAALGS